MAKSSHANEPLESSRGKTGPSKPSEKYRTEKEGGLIEKVVQINRIAKVVKGGRRFHFSALVVIGNGNGKIGYALAKAGEVADAIRKSLAHAKKNQFEIPLHKTTITHEVWGEYGAAKVFLKPASEGTGVIAGGAVRAVCECLGIRDILTKSLGSDNAINVLKATVSGLQSMKTGAAGNPEPAAKEIEINEKQNTPS